MELSSGLESSCRSVGIINLLIDICSLSNMCRQNLDDTRCFSDSFSCFIASNKKKPMPISDCEVLDPRIRRTRHLLQGALHTLMQTKGFDEISVHDIAEAATVNRATFYDHYTDKFALLEATVAGGFHVLLHQRNICFDGTCPSAAGAIILAACDYLTQSHTGSACTRQS